MFSGKQGLSNYVNEKFLSVPFCASLLNENKISSLLKLEKYTRLENIFILSISKTLEISGLNPADKKTLLIVSTTKGNISLLEKKNIGGFPDKRLKLDIMAAEIATYFGFANQPVVVSNACISGVMAIIAAKRLIESGEYKNIIVSGGDEVSQFTLSGFNSLKALSDEPCRPYDAARKGINLGEGCATLLLSSDEKILDKTETKINVTGGSLSNDANHISGPSRTGEELALAINKAVKEAKCENRIDFISAHGTATAFNDEMEAKAFSAAGLQDIPLNSMKGFFGHTLGAAGVIESVATLECMKNNTLLLSPGYSEHGVSMPLNIIRKPEKKEITVSLKTASGFGGCNAAVVFEKV